MKWTLKRPVCPRLNPESALIIKNGVGDVGKKMWSFASMMFLITLKPGTMGLVAGHSMAVAIATFLFANSIGTLIDRIPRLTAIRVSIAGQAFGVAVIAIMMIAIQIKGDVLECVPVELYVVFTILCLMGVVSRLAKEASKIIIGRDWTVTVCHGDRTRLARLNVWTSRTDEVFGIVSPLAISALRQVLSMMQTTLIGATFYFISTCIQYSLILFVYRHVESIRTSKNPEKRKGRRRAVTPPPPYSEDVVAINGAPPLAPPLAEGDTRTGKPRPGPGRRPPFDKQDPSDDRQGPHGDRQRPHGGRRMGADGRKAPPHDRPKGGEGVNGLAPPEYGSPKTRRPEDRGPPNRNPRRHEDGGDDSPGQRKKEKETKKKKSRKPNIFDPRELYNNFKKFFTYRIALAGICQCLQHLSLVSFGIVTMLYMRDQGMNYLYLGVARSSTGVIAIIASIIFPRFVKRYGLVMSGFVGCFVQVLACCGALAAMYVPAYNNDIVVTNSNGDVIDPCIGNFLSNETFPMPEFDDKFAAIDQNYYFNDEVKKRNKNKQGNSTTTDPGSDIMKTGGTPGNLKQINVTNGIVKNNRPDPLVRMDENNVVQDKNITDLRPRPKPNEGAGVKTKGGRGGNAKGGGKGTNSSDSDGPSLSALVLLGSLLFGRFGTFLSRISVHQLYQEEIPKNERGVVAGVQTTMSTFFNTISMIIVLYANKPENFIYLVWMSTGVELIVMALYSYFAFNYSKSRGGISDTDPAQPQMLEEDPEEEPEDELSSMVSLDQYGAGNSSADNEGQLYVNQEEKHTATV